MSIEAVVSRIDQIYAYQQTLLNPASLASQTSATSTSTSSGASFADQLASAQGAGSTASASATDDASAVDPLLGTADSTQAITGLSDTGTSTGLAGAAKMLAAAQSAVGGTYSQANHDAVDDTASQIQQLGTDCSGFVSYLMGPNGLGAWSQSCATPGIPSAPDLASGQGQYVTIWNNPNPGDAGHVWIEILGKYYESAGGVGVHQMSQAEVNQYLATGQYEPFHPVGM